VSAVVVVSQRRLVQQLAAAQDEASGTVLAITGGRPNTAVGGCPAAIGGSCGSEGLAVEPGLAWQAELAELAELERQAALASLRACEDEDEAAGFVGSALGLDEP
jgi:hypothetical protein